MRPVRAALSMMLGAALVAALPRVVLAAPSARLVYLRNPGAEGCPEENAVRAAVAARLGYDPFFPQAPDTMFAEVERAGGAYRVRMKLVDRDNLVRGARQIEVASSRCADIIDAMALTLSIAIDPDSLMRAPGTPPPGIPETAPPEPPPASEARPEPPSSPPVVAAPPPARESATQAPPSRGPRVDVAASAMGWAGAAPSASVAALASVGLAWPGLVVSIEGRADAFASRDVQRGAVRTSFLGGGVAACVPFARVLRACGLGQVGRLEADAVGIAFPRTDRALHALAGVRGAVRLPLSDTFDALAHLDALVALTPQRLQIDGADAFTLSRVSVGLGLGLAAHFF